MNRRTLLVVVAVLSCLVMPSCDDYGKDMQAAFKSGLGSDFSDYQFFSYPTSNFGVWTMYDGGYDPTNFLCATWTCLGIAAPTASADILDVAGNADAGTGGNISLSTSNQQDIGANVVVPQILGMLQVTGSANYQKNITVGLIASGGHKRFVIAQKFADYMNTLPATDVRLKAYRDGTLTVIWSDAVIDSMTVTIDINTSLEASLDAQMTKALSGKVGTVIGQGADLQFTVTAATTGHYQLQTAQSVVVAVLAKTSPKPTQNFAFGSKIPVPNFTQWKTKRLDLKTLKAATKKPLQVK